jgi:hypothetical protein
VKFTPRNQAVAGAVVVIVAVIAGVVLLSNRGDQVNAGQKTIIINQMIVSIPTLLGIVVALVKSTQAAEKAAETAEKADAMHEDLKNGLIPQKVEEAINNMASDPENDTVTINHNGDSAA